MQSKSLASRFIAGALLCALAQFAAADWKYYEAKNYGFSMLVPEGTKMTSKELGGGWGQLWGNADGVKLYGMAKLGAKESDADIEKYAVKTIGIPAAKWKMIDSGSARGFERYKTFEAVDGSKLYFGGYGVGKKGNYLLYLETTVSDYNEHKADYNKWYESIRLD
ncbi:MAG TPA: hypothetical protein VLH12_07085 [Usitatibacter sp.]|jgi:hypothetical protein|nr:hypothetical protein [Usitatibacter sp.]